MSGIHLVAFDLDGTLLTPDGSLAMEEYTGLCALGKAGIYRVVATGRSLVALREVLPENAPVDYVVFSSGNGLLEWRSGQIILRRRLSAGRVRMLVQILMDEGIPFMAQGLIPNNHRMVYWRGKRSFSTDFDRRVERHKMFACEIIEMHDAWLRSVSQLVVPMPEGTPREGGIIARLQEHGSVVIATSPYDGRSIWIEVFSHGVSKGCALGWLCKRLSLVRGEVVTVGNDYNDLSMLEAFPHSFVMGNAPLSMRERFPKVRSNAAHGCRQVMEWVLSKN